MKDIIIIFILIAIIFVISFVLINWSPNNNVACTMDAKQCPDGSFVGRNPNNNCNFYPCPESNNDTKMCTLDVKQCPDGSFVGRNPNNNCVFFPCY